MKTNAALDSVPHLDSRTKYNHTSWHKDHAAAGPYGRLPLDMTIQNSTAMFDPAYSIYTLDRQEKYIMGIHPPVFNMHPSEGELEFLRHAQQSVSMGVDYSQDINLMLCHGETRYPPCSQFPFQDGSMNEQMMRAQQGHLIPLPQHLQLHALPQQSHLNILR